MIERPDEKIDGKPKCPVCGSWSCIHLDMTPSIAIPSGPWSYRRLTDRLIPAWEIVGPEISPELGIQRLYAFERQVCERLRGLNQIWSIGRAFGEQERKCIQEELMVTKTQLDQARAINVRQLEIHAEYSNSILKELQELKGTK